MLRQEPNETAPLPAAQVRVTPEELAAAITRLEARKDAGQRHVDGTIPIGEAVQQLGIETTPEEVLAEVQAGRQQATPRKKRASIGQRVVLALGLSGILLGLALGGNSLSQMRSHETASVSVSNAIHMPIQLDPNLLVSTASGNLVTLSKVGDNQPVQCNLSNEHNRVAFYQWTPGTTAQDSWTLIKHNGKMYVRGWTFRMPPRLVETDGVDIYADRSRGGVVPITLPLRGFEALPYAGSGERFHAVNIHLDQHANEKWQP